MFIIQSSQLTQVKQEPWGPLRYPSGNAQGSWYVMLIATGDRIHRYQWDIIPIGEDTIEIVHALARQHGIPQVDGNFVYEVEQGQMMEDDDDEEEENIVEIIKGNNDDN